MSWCAFQLLQKMHAHLAIRILLEVTLICYILDPSASLSTWSVDILTCIELYSLLISCYDQEERIRSTPTFYQLRCQLSHQEPPPPTYHIRNRKIFCQVQQIKINMVRTAAHTALANARDAHTTGEPDTTRGDSHLATFLIHLCPYLVC